MVENGDSAKIAYMFLHTQYAVAHVRGPFRMTGEPQMISKGLYATNFLKGFDSTLNFEIITPHVQIY